MRLYWTYIINLLFSLGTKKWKKGTIPYLLFWYQVLTCVSVRLRASATSALSATLRYFWHLNFLSKYCNCACVKAVRRRRGFFIFVNTVPNTAWSALLSVSLSVFSLLFVILWSGESTMMSRSASLLQSLFAASSESLCWEFVLSVCSLCSCELCIALKYLPSTNKLLCKAVNLKWWLCQSWKLRLILKVHCKKSNTTVKETNTCVSGEMWKSEIQQWRVRNHWWWFALRMFRLFLFDIFIQNVLYEEWPLTHLENEMCQQKR